MKKRKVNALLAIGLFLTMMVGIAGCGKEQQLAAEIDPDTPVSEVQFPLKETAELSFITSAPATSTQEPNERVIFQRMEEQTNVHIDWTCFVSDQFSDKKNLALAQFGNLPDGLFNAGMSEYDLLRYAKQGIIIPLENLIDKYMPNLQAVFEKYPEYRTMCTAPDGMRNITRQNNSETSGFDRGRCVLTSSCRDTALAAAWIDQMYAPLQSPQNNWGTYGEKDSFNIFELSRNKDGGEMLKHMDLGTQSPVEVREAQSVNGPLAVLNEYYDVYVTQPEDAKWRLDNMHETYLQDMNSKYVYPNVFMSIEDTNKVSQYDTDIRKYAEQKKADWILNGGIEKEWDSYLKKMEQYGLPDYLSIKQKYFDQYQKSLSEEK